MLPVTAASSEYLCKYVILFTAIEFSSKETGQAAIYCWSVKHRITSSYIEIIELNFKLSFLKKALVNISYQPERL